ncbi:hypothetical protein ASF48_05005 [Rathayibacter sp. Leaf299]|uniref:hypothetical protein n=1 Tax=Rathayibacter sp. Leaf299 TaxID=1736328 RepID=UPI0006FD30B5|nr:hypothetical protein [Rathayibacter sp. Leaf299]KQQ22545.1 hypothetical protein ASF48_05005 [Rathayibacter sp. Leaf299]
MSQPAKYRKKPVVIDAMQHDGTEESARAVLAWADPLTLGSTLAARKKGTDDWTVVIETLEGAMAADSGDWIIRGVQGEFYPCKPDIFAATYEAA